MSASMRGSPVLPYAAMVSSRGVKPATMATGSRGMAVTPVAGFRMALSVTATNPQSVRYSHRVKALQTRLHHAWTRHLVAANLLPYVEAYLHGLRAYGVLGPGVLDRIARSPVVRRKRRGTPVPVVVPSARANRGTRSVTASSGVTVVRQWGRKTKSATDSTMIAMAPSMRDSG